MTKSGHRHVRWMTTELAWSWLRFQPDSALSCWLRERFGGGGKRLRRIGIVAVARKFLIALWRFLETGGLTRGGGAQRGVSDRVGLNQASDLVLVEAARCIAGPAMHAVV
jgi:transposase